MSQIQVMSSSRAANRASCDRRPARVSHERRGRSRRRRRCGGAGRVARAQQAPAARRRPRRYGPGAEPVRYPDPDVVVLDKRFAKIKIGNSPIRRLHTGMLWAEGPAWNGVGKYLVMSDIPNDIQLRWIEDDGHVSVIRRPAGNSNGNTFDPEGRQISCEHGNRRVVRYEHDGKTTVLADRFGGKPLNAPNDAVVHPDGGIWFTDPGYGSLSEYEGNKGPLEIKEAVYRIDPKTGQHRQGHRRPLQAQRPLFLARLQDPLHRRHRRLPLPGGPAQYPGVRRRRRRQARQGPRVCLDEDGHAGRWRAAGFADGIRVDVEGNLYAAAGWVGPGYDGVHVFAPDGVRIGLILLPEICANVCFGGPKRNRLFMAASQSLYAVYLDTRGRISRDREQGR